METFDSVEALVVQMYGGRPGAQRALA